MSTGRTQRDSKQTPAAPMSRRERLAAWARRYRFLAGTVAAVVAALWLCWFVFYGPHGVSEWRKVRALDRTLQAEILQLQKENNDLSRHIDQLRDSPDAIEREARERLHYAKPGEVIYTLPEPQSSTPGSGTK